MNWSTRLHNAARPQRRPDGNCGATADTPAAANTDPLRKVAQSPVNSLNRKRNALRKNIATCEWRLSR